MSEKIVKPAKDICTFCQTPIKNEAETLYCPSCNSPYHVDCWTENKGCAVYGCGEKVADSGGITLREGIINIEYLINRNQFSEAIFEAKEYLRIEGRNIEIKNLYNKAVALINNKINLMSSGDEAFSKGDYKSAEIYYRNVLKYADEIETNFVSTRLEIAKEKIPEQNRRRVYQNLLIVVIILAILSAIGYLGYYAFVLKEDREFAELTKTENVKDLRSLEQTIVKYESFLNTYPEGRNKKKVLNKIYGYSRQAASAYFKDDWRLALKYYNKFSSIQKDSSEKKLYNDIYQTAYSDYSQKLSNAKKLNSISKYSEAVNELNSATSIASYFPDTEMSAGKKSIESNIALLNKKISSLAKSNDLEREIREQDKQLSNIKSSGVEKNTQLISATLTKKIESGIFIANEYETGDVIAIKAGENEFDFNAGDEITVECIPKGTINLPGGKKSDKPVNLYLAVAETEINTEALSMTEREAISERIRNLKTQKAKYDSLLKLSLM